MSFGRPSPDRLKRYDPLVVDRLATWDRNIADWRARLFLYELERPAYPYPLHFAVVRVAWKW